MNSLDINHIKIEKANAIKFRHQKLRKITGIFRVFEVVIVLGVISRFSFQVPLALGLAFKLSYEYFQYLSLLLVSPQFIFVLGNVIVITLFLNSRHFKTSPEVKLLESPSHEHKVPKSLPKKQGITEENTMLATIFAPPPQVKLPKSPPHEHRITKLQPKKQGTTEESTMMAAIFTALPPEHRSHHNQVIKVYHRSTSEKPRREKTETGCSSLRRSNTEVIKNLKEKEGCRKEEAGEGHYPEDHMSNEEFRRAIEDFIAKQQRFLREEEEFSFLESNFDL